jgi:hypothetical protein
MFHRKKNESAIESRKRILKNVQKTAVTASLAIGAIAATTYWILAPMLANGFTWKIDLPFQTKEVVFAEYASIGILNGAIAHAKWKKQEKREAFYHSLVGLLSFAFPSFYWNNDMRLHHSFYGLLLMSTPSRPLRMLGSAITFDSSLYMFEPLRGYDAADPQFGGTSFYEYDFINTILDHPSLYASGYAGALILENLNQNLPGDKNPPSAEIQKISQSLQGHHSINLSCAPDLKNVR